MGGTNEPLWDASDMHAFRAEGVAAEREQYPKLVEAVTELRAQHQREVEALRENNMGWLQANGPCGWIDDLRREVGALRAALTAIQAEADDAVGFGPATMETAMHAIAFAARTALLCPPARAL